MKHLNQLESQLRSWKPRPPSASLKKRLFPEAESTVPIPAFAIGRWLAPAMAIFALGMVYLHQNPEYLTQLNSSNSVALMSVNLSEASHGHTYAAAAPSDRNIWSAMTFDSTNAGQSLSTSSSGSPKGGLFH